VRSQAKATQIKDNFSEYGSDKLDFAFVEDIAQDGAFDDAVKSNPPFEAVVCGLFKAIYGIWIGLIYNRFTQHRHIPWLSRTSRKIC
jgi:hypothetical protein